MKYHLSDVFQLQMGKTPSRNNPEYWSNGTQKWVSISDMSNYEKYTAKTKEAITDLAVKETRIKQVPANTVIMSFKLSIGKVAITSEPLYTNEAIMAFINRGLIDVLPDYLYYQLESIDFSVWSKRAVMGATLNKNSLSDLDVRIPSALEQKRVVNNLDSVSSLVSILNHILIKLESLVKSRFIEMFENASCVDVVPFGELCESLRNGATIKQGKSCSGYPITRIETISGDVFNFDKMGFGDVFDIAPYEQFIMQPDDLLISHINSMKHLGRTVRFPGSDIQIIHGMNLLRARLNERCNPVYMEWLMKSDSTRAYIHSIAKQSVNQASFTVSALRKMPVKLPSLDLQNEFSCFVARIDKLRFDVRKQIERLETLKRSLMQDYFG